MRNKDMGFFLNKKWAQKNDEYNDFGSIQMNEFKTKA